MPSYLNEGEVTYCNIWTYLMQVKISYFQTTRKSDKIGFIVIFIKTRGNRAFLHSHFMDIGFV